MVPFFLHPAIFVYAPDQTAKRIFTLYTNLIKLEHFKTPNFISIQAWDFILLISIF
jgi:hypothetical protein